MRLADALSMRLDGHTAVDARLNGRQVWPTPPATIEWFGNQATGTHRFPTSTNRCCVDRHTLAVHAQVLAIHVYVRPNYAGPTNIRGMILSDVAGDPAAVLVASDIVLAPDADGWVRCAATGELPAGAYWLGAVADRDARYFVASDNGGTRMANETFSFDPPPETWPAAGINQYASALSVYVEYVPLL